VQAPVPHSIRGASGCAAWTVKGPTMQTRPTLASTQPLVSVVIPAYNVASRFVLFKEAILSVLAQTHRPLEIVVVDDCSADASVSLIEEYLHRFADLPWRLIRSEVNSGPSIARNIGIKQSRGEVVAFLDWDDLYFPQFLESAINAMRREAEASVVLAPTYFYREWNGSARVYASVIPNALNSLSFVDFCAYIVENNFPVAMGSAVVCRRSLFESNKDLWFDSYLSKLTAEDVLFGFSFLSHGIRPIVLDSPLVVHRGYIGVGSRGFDAFLKTDELTVQDYISKKSVDGLIERIAAVNPERARGLRTRQAKLRNRFLLKRHLSQNRYGQIVPLIAADPGLAKAFLTFLAYKFSWLPGVNYLLQCQTFAITSSETALKQINALLRDLHTSEPK
jgi:glycosyltransferase involved in cell wall biosynthesis